MEDATVLRQKRAIGRGADPVEAGRALDAGRRLDAGRDGQTFVVAHMGLARRLVIAKLAGVGLAAVLVMALSATATVRAQTKAPRLKIVAFGDSLTAGFGLPATESFPAQLQASLEKQGRNVEILNAGVSGDTASAGLERLDWAVPPDADGVIVELGANDALRGLDPAQTRKALDAIIVRLKARGVEVLLAGMQAPRNLGEDYRNKFDKIFIDLAQAHGLILRPFFMEGMAFDPKYTLADRLHPTAGGVGIIVEGILPDVLRLIERIEAKAKKKS